MGFDLLRYFFIVQHCSWLIKGDFNEILYYNEKLGGATRPHRQMSLFYDVLQDYQLLDLGFSRSKCTWSNNRSDRTFTKEMLDRALASANWISTFEDRNIQVLHFAFSDHLPLLLTVTLN